jgi:hypothetical protein
VLQSWLWQQCDIWWVAVGSTMAWQSVLQHAWVSLALQHVADDLACVRVRGSLQGAECEVPGSLCCSM